MNPFVQMIRSYNRRTARQSADQALVRALEAQEQKSLAWVMQVHSSPACVAHSGQRTSVTHSS